MNSSDSGNSLCIWLCISNFHDLKLITWSLLAQHIWIFWCFSNMFDVWKLASTLYYYEPPQNCFKKASHWIYGAMFFTVRPAARWETWSAIVWVGMTNKIVRRPGVDGWIIPMWSMSFQTGFFSLWDFAGSAGWKFYVKIGREIFFVWFEVEVEGNND